MAKEDPKNASQHKDKIAMLATKIDDLMSKLEKVERSKKAKEEKIAQEKEAAKKEKSEKVSTEKTAKQSRKAKEDTKEGGQNNQKGREAS